MRQCLFVKQSEIWKKYLSGISVKNIEKQRVTATVATLLNPFPNKPWFFTCLQYKTFENTVGKGEIAHDEQFLLFPQCFLPL